MFFTREWFETLYTTTHASAEDAQSLLLLCVVDEGKVLALLPLVGSNDRWQSFSHKYTALYSLLLAEDNKSEILSCLASSMSQMPIHSLQLSPVAEDDANLSSLQRAMELSGYECHKHFFFYNWFYRTHQQSFDEYLSGRPSQLRNTIARKQRKLEREHEYQIRLFQGNDVQQGLKDYHAAYSASWKANEQYVELLEAAANNLSRPGWTRLAIMYIDGKVAAAQLWFVVQGKASIFRLAYDEEWKRYSPGSILTAYLMQYVIDTDKVDEIDFLTGNEPYKQDWMSERRQRLRVLFVKQAISRTAFSLFLDKVLNVFKSLFNQ
ncbi:MAG: GNAT family N-acetyltransferase [Gammaproteobacteria bacterium]|nr:GNAT family N-acetyltransferase [Gammaproteobacteria bacterium]